ncbi:hypothetical protein JMJ35_000735 [Cladonia borealis]|uniref:Uncharacterized protein n=1 Tax=Cladonia borealis TaxID=184061 RepID=A0AA39V4V3_9LECA|nr:hypothetical protein JMJ35_000735 [Cladonia borealis]
MSDHHSRGSSRGSNPSPSKERTYLEPESNKSKDGYLNPYYSPSSRVAKGLPFTSTSSSNNSSRSPSKPSRRPAPKAAIIHNDPDAPKDKDPYKKTADARYHKNSFLDSDEPKEKDSLASKAYDPGYYHNSSFYKD